MQPGPPDKSDDIQVLHKVQMAQIYYIFVEFQCGVALLAEAAEHLVAKEFPVQPDWDVYLDFAVISMAELLLCTLLL